MEIIWYFTIGPIGVSAFHLSSNTRIKFFRRLFVFSTRKMWGIYKLTFIQIDERKWQIGFLCSQHMEHVLIRYVFCSGSTFVAARKKTFSQTRSSLVRTIDVSGQRVNVHGPKKMQEKIDTPHLRYKFLLRVHIPPSNGEFRCTAYTHECLL